jgi:D-aspartate ligase
MSRRSPISMDGQPEAHRKGMPISAASEYPVVITAADHPTGLITARSLRDAPAQLIGLCRHRHLPPCRSNLWAELHALGESEAEVEANLVRLGKRFSRKPVLLPIQDDLVEKISRLRERLSAYYLFTLPPEDAVAILLDKAAFHHWAENHGFRVPESRIVSNLEDLQAFLRALDFRAVVKPYLKTDLWERMNPRDKVFKLEGPADCARLPPELFAASPKLVVQQWIPGGDDAVYFCLIYFDRQGREAASFSGRKLHQWPVDCGSTAVAVSAAGAEIEAITRKLFRQLGYRGLGSVEFKRDPRDGTFYIIEPTVGRNDLQSYVSVPCGLNLTRLAFDELVTGTVTPPRPRAVRSLWINEATILDSLRADPERMSRRLVRLARLALGSRSSFAYFSLRDPAPFLRLLRNMVSGKLQRRFGRQRMAALHG